MTQATDSRIDTYEHIHQVQRCMAQAVRDLGYRALVHDESKLVAPEVTGFDEVKQRLWGLTYGSPEYQAALAELKPTLDHHYANNSHHPEHYPNGIHGMTLLDVVEMLCDWKAATMRHADGSILKSIEINQRRFGYSDDLKQIFLNTVQEMGWA